MLKMYIGSAGQEHQSFGYIAWINTWLKIKKKSIVEIRFIIFMNKIRHFVSFQL